MWLCRRGLSYLAQLTIKCGAQLEIVSALGYTPLHAAVDLGDASLVAFLLGRQAPIDFSSSDGATALHRAAMKGNFVLTSLLIERGALLNVQTKDGYTALHYAVQEGHDEVVNLLLWYKASMELTDCFNRTPLHIAAWVGNQTIAGILIDYGAHINAQRCELTALDVADRMGHNGIVNDLLKKGASRFLIDKEKLHKQLLLPLHEIEVPEGCVQISPQWCDAE